jgi:hypothetical protein
VPIEDVKHLRNIEAAYEAATNQLGRPPASEAQLRPYLKRYGNPDDLLRSPRDGRPYVIQWGINIQAARAKLPPRVIAHEAAGVNGRRYVLTVMGVGVMTEEQLAEATAGRK